MDSFAHSYRPDAKGSTFTRVDGNQVNYNFQSCSVTIYTSSPFTSKEAPAARCLPQDNRSSTLFVDSKISSSKSLHQSDDPIVVIQATTILIDYISTLLIDPADTMNNCELLHVLKKQRQILCVVECAITAYSDKPLGQSLNNAIAPVVMRCRVLLLELSGKIHDTWVGVICTRISLLWRRIFRERWEGDELASLKARLRNNQNILGMFLIALNSVVWMEFGNELCTGYITIKKFHDLLQPQLPSLRHIQVDVVQVVDHLGRFLFVPILFCSTWRGFDYIINGYSKDLPGSRFIALGDYELLHPQDSRIVRPSEFVDVVKPGMTFDMSITTRKRMDFKDNKEKCPRCRHVNSNATAVNGWVVCRKCAVQFQVAEHKRRNTNDESEGPSAKETCPRCQHINVNVTVINGRIECCNCAGQFYAEKQQGGEPLDRRTCPKCHYANSNVTAINGWIKCHECPNRFQLATLDNELDGEPFDEEINGVRDREDGVNHDEKIISPTLTHSIAVDTTNGADNNNLRRQDNNDMQYIRRIRVIFLEQSSSSDSKRKERQAEWIELQKYEKIDIEDLAQVLRVWDITSGVQLDAEHPVPIGCGTSGEVARGLYTWTEHTTLQVFVTKVAIKQLVGEEQQRLEKQVIREAVIWRSLSHPNVTTFLGIAYLYGPGCPPCLISKLVRRNDLMKYIGRHPGSTISTAQGIARGVQYLHSNRIVHGDLHVDNVLITDEGVAQINDFGMSRILDVGGFTIGPVYRNIRFNSPELMPITNELFDVLPTFKSDIFSLAILFLQLFNGLEENFQKALPYNHIIHRNNSIDFGLLRRIHNGERPIRERYSPMSDQHWNLLSLCWQGDPNARPNIDFVVCALL